MYLAYIPHNSFIYLYQAARPIKTNDNAMPKKIPTKCNVFLQLIILRPHPHLTRHIRKKSAKPSAFYTFENRYRDFSFTGTFVPGERKFLELSFLGPFVPGERKFQGTFVPRTFRSEELSFPGNESSWERKVLGTKVPGTFVPRERKVSGTKVPHRDYSFLGTKGLGHEKSRYLYYRTFNSS